MMTHPALYVIVLLRFFLSVNARVWNDTGKGSIIFEEAWTIPELIDQQDGTAPPLSQSLDQLKANLLDIHNQRLAEMDASGVDFMVLSCASPCVQGISDPIAAAELATSINDQLAASISNNTMRFGAFATLAMHNASVAAQELNRTVTELGFLGALLNDYQQSGPDNATLLYYDQPEFDVFWQMVTDLDVPVYMHPRVGISQLTALQYQHSIFLNGPQQEFAVSLSTHVMGLCTNGIFDRFPTAKVIVGHLGERITSDLFRIDEQLARRVPEGMPMLRNLSSYWRTNLFETTSGNFATPLLAFHTEQIGLDRILYSVDYPYIDMAEGAAWLKTLPLSSSELIGLQRGRAIELLGLNK
ncbi:amidohydrolase 2 [Gautieria morchelliformis]|nr:amidohydrolase 2 [Gautieria morchelliformis]